MAGNGGQDFLDGGGGADKVGGGGGFDVLSYQTRTQPVTAEPLPAPISGEVGQGDEIGLDVEAILGGTGNDTLSTAPVVTPTWLVGGSGDDRFVATEFSLPFKPDAFTGGPGTDTIDYSQRSRSVAVFLDNQVNDGDLVAGISEGDAVFPDIENAVGGSANDVFLGTADNNRFEGGAGNDWLFDLAGGADYLHGGVGSDRVLGGPGVDVVVDTAATAGQTNNDYIDGGADTDLLSGVADDDIVIGGPGADYIFGGIGNDLLDARDGGLDPIVSCDEGADVAKLDPQDSSAAISGCESVQYP